MIPGGLLGLLPLLLGLFGPQPGTFDTVVTRLVIQDEMVLRVPLEPQRVAPDIQWIERKSAKCIPIGAIRQALMSGPTQLDFVMADHSRVRAHLDDDCPALAFYGGFYLQPEDQRLCAERDAIRSRMGTSCGIQAMKQLVPKLQH